MARKILEAPLEFPPHFSEDSKDIIRKFLQRNPSKRLADGDQIRAHAFFRDINWAELELRHLEPPYVPAVASESDVSNFDPEFTQSSIAETPAQARLDLV
eukprot:12974_5